ncbi:unnamed protein product, partial [Prorocentrum cordatum]
VPIGNVMRTWVSAFGLDRRIPFSTGIRPTGGSRGGHGRVVGWSRAGRVEGRGWVAGGSQSGRGWVAGVTEEADFRWAEVLRQAASAPGGAVYVQQDVVGLSDADAAAPLVAAFAPLGPEGEGFILAGLSACARTSPSEVVLAGLGRCISVCSHDEASPDERARGRPLLLQSSFKPLVYAMVLESGLGGELERAVGDEGDRGFADPGSTSDGRAFNPLINSGALVALELLSRRYSVEEVGAWCCGRTDGGADPSQPRLFDPRAVAATIADSARNRRLCAGLAAAGLMPAEEAATERAVVYYAHMDCLLLTVGQLAAVARAFARTAEGPGGDEAAASGAARCSLECSLGTVRRVREVMLRCGMYEASSAWRSSGGPPAKSGVSGVVWGSVEGATALLQAAARELRAGGRGQAGAG